MCVEHIATADISHADKHERGTDGYSVYVEHIATAYISHVESMRA